MKPQSWFTRRCIRLQLIIIAFPSVTCGIRPRNVPPFERNTIKIRSEPWHDRSGQAMTGVHRNHLPPAFVRENPCQATKINVDQKNVNTSCFASTKSVAPPPPNNQTKRIPSHGRCPTCDIRDCSINSMATFVKTMVPTIA